MSEDIVERLTDLDHNPTVADMQEAAAEIERLRAIVDAVIQQARIWAGEAKTQRSTVEEIGSILGGLPNWGPIAKKVSDLSTIVDRLPKDAEGETVCIKDRVYWVNNGRIYPATVIGIDEQNRVCIEPDDRSYPASIRWCIFRRRAAAAAEAAAAARETEAKERTDG